MSKQKDSEGREAYCGDCGQTFPTADDYFHHHCDYDDRWSHALYKMCSSCNLSETDECSGRCAVIVE